MSLSAYDSPILIKTRELCAQIVEDPRYVGLLGQIETFLDDDNARLMYQSVHQRGEELHHKQHSGIELSASEIREFEEAREALLDNPVATAFLEAQSELEQLQRTIRKHINLTLELGRVPTAEDLEESSGGGCCGGGGGGGCGCSH